MLVTTVNGKKVDRDLCRKIEDKYYLIGDINVEDSGDCYEIDGRFIRIESGYIVFDVLNKQYTRKSHAGIRQGVVDYTDSPQFGYFSLDRSLEFNVVFNGTIYPCINEEVIKKANLKYNPREGNWSSSNRNNSNQTRYETFNTSQYGMTEEAREAVEHWCHRGDPSILTPYLKYTVGIEYETSIGNVPEYLCYRHGLIPVKDGSISGHEYVTFPMNPEEISIIDRQCKALSEYGAVDKYCSLHNHMGGFPYKDKLRVLSLYELCRRLQDEIFYMLPPFKRDLRYFLSKPNEKKDHCQLLPGLAINVYDGDEISSRMVKQSFGNLVTFLNQGVPPEEDDGRFIHIDEGRNKWDYKRRYYWVNLIPLLFQEKATVEFRAHHGTLNRDKVLIWLFITNAIMRYAERYPDKVLRKRDKITLEDVIRGYADNFGKEDIDGSNIVRNVIEYIIQRTAKFQSDHMKDDMESVSEFENDSKYKFQWVGVELPEVKVIDSNVPKRTGGKKLVMREAPVQDFAIEH